MTRPDFQDDDSESGPVPVLEPSESLDEDELGAEETVMDPPDAWSGADRYGTTAGEESADRPLDARLDEERPDVPRTDAPVRPVAATPLDELDDSIDEEIVPGEPGGVGFGQGRLIAGEDVSEHI